MYKILDGRDYEFEIVCCECGSKDCQLKIISKWNYTIVCNNCGSEGIDREAFDENK